MGIFAIFFTASWFSCAAKGIHLQTPLSMCNFIQSSADLQKARNILADNDVRRWRVIEINKYLSSNEPYEIDASLYFYRDGTYTYTNGENTVDLKWEVYADSGQVMLSTTIGTYNFSWTEDNGYHKIFLQKKDGRWEDPITEIILKSEEEIE